MTHITFDPHYHIITLRPESHPDNDDFELWARIYLHHDDIELGEFEQGADRHMQRFTFAGHSFELHFEHYGDNLWISPVGVQAQQQLEKLGHYLSAN